MALAVRIPSRRRIETHLFLLLVPAGILADRHDRPNFLLATHAVMALSALGLSLTITAGLVTPQILLVGTLVIGCGAALTMPAWQAAVSTLVEPGQIHSAAALNGMSFNFARAVGPALAGFIAQAATIATIFWINAVSFLGLILVFWRWRTGSARIRATKSEPPCEATAMGFSAMLSNSRFRSLLVRTFICFFGASSMWSLLPAFAALHLQMEAAEVGLLMGTLGVGAVLGGALLPRLKAKIGLNRLITVASTQLGLALLLAAWNGTSVAIWVSMLATGVGWAFIVSSLNGSAQLMFPKSIRASAISAYLMVMYGATTSGSCLWGALSAYSVVSTTFIVAAWMLILSPSLHRVGPLNERKVRARRRAAECAR